MKKTIIISAIIVVILGLILMRDYNNYFYGRSLINYHILPYGLTPFHYKDRYHIVNGKINVKNLSDLSLNKSSLYVMTSDKSGIVLESEPIEANPYVDCLNSPQSPTQTELAVAHYFGGNGEPADVGDRATAMLMNTQTFKDNVKVTTTAIKENGEFSVDMTGKVFHIGRTPVNYTVHHGSKSSHVDFRLFQYKNGRMDSFSDPLDVGIELPGGTPYDYKLRTVTYYFKPVK